jgi:hypothetical protein
MPLEYLKELISLIDVVAWPATAIIIICALKGKIQELLLKHKDTEIHLKLKEISKKKAEASVLIEQVESEITKLEPNKCTNTIKENLERIKTLTLGSLEKEANFLAKICTTNEASENANGKYTIYNNGLVTQSLTIDAEAISRESMLVFPCAFQSSEISVTFVGEEVPSIFDIRSTSMTIGLEQPNKKPIKIILSGM